MTGLLVWSNNNWRVPFIVLGAIGLVIAAVWYWIIRDTPADHPRITAEELALITSDQLPEESVIADKVPPLRFYLRLPAVIANAVAFFGFSWLLFMFLSWYPLFLVQTQHINLSSLAWAGALPWVAGSIGTALGGILSDRLARRSGTPFKMRKWITATFLALSGALCVPLTAVDSLGLARNRLDGNFPGGTVVLNYRFALAGTLIAGLDIKGVGGSRPAREAPALRCRRSLSARDR